MFIVVWRYRVVPQFAEEFIRAYGREGEWAGFFGNEPGYRGTELVASVEPGVYATIDRWDDAESYDHFMSSQSESYHRLDHGFERLTIEEAWSSAALFFRQGHRCTQTSHPNRPEFGY